MMHTANTPGVSPNRSTAWIGLLCFLVCTVTTFGNPAESSVLNVRNFGAIGDGETKDTAAIQKAIDACAQAGGGTVFIPAGTYLCGSLHLLSDVSLYLDAGATICASPDEADFDPYETLNYETDSDRETTYMHYSLIWGEEVQRVSVLGPGTIDGNREQRGGPKPLAFKRCQSITIRDVTILNAPNYCISMLGCDDVTIDGVTIRNAYCDGIDPDGCRYVRISNCHIESWDDAIVLKSSFALGERRPTEYVTVTNCVLSTSCNAFKLGTESGGDFRSITACNLVMYSPVGKRPMISGIALESVDGADIDRIAISNVTMEDVATPIFMRLGNRGRDMEQPVPGSLRNVAISNIVATGATLACSITGIPDHPIENVMLSQIAVEYRGGGTLEMAQRTVPEMPDKYPEATMFEVLPAYGSYCRHARNITFRDVHLKAGNADERPVMVCNDVAGLVIRDLQGDNWGTVPYLHFTNVRDASLGPLVAPERTKVFLSLDGEHTADIRVTGSDLRHVVDPFRIAPEASSVELFENANRLPESP